MSRGIFFEGWYFKLTLEQHDSTLAIIPGVHMNDDDRFAFVLVAHGNASHFFRFPFASFASSTDQFLATVDGEKNVFSYDKLLVDLHPKETDDATGRFRLNLTLSSHVTNPDISWLLPGTMGIFSWVPTIQCYHHVLSMKYQVQGTAQIHDEAEIPVNGIGYLEKDWGHSFPSAWVWAQANQWENLPSDSSPSLFFSLARIPWHFNINFPGFLVIFEHNGAFYRFNTYLQSVVAEFSADKTTNRVTLTVYDVLFEHKLQVTTHCSKPEATRGAILYGPRAGRMEKFVEEILSPNIYFDVRLSKLIPNDSVERTSEDPFVQHGYGEEVLFQGRAVKAALEINGDIPELIEMFRTTYAGVLPWNFSLGRSLVRYYKLILSVVGGMLIVRMLFRRRS